MESCYHGSSIDGSPLMLARLSVLGLLLLSCYPAGDLMAEPEMYIIDDRTSGDLLTTSGTSWRFVTDGVMGGKSDGRLDPTTRDNRNCLHLQGDVRLDNNGGFIQASLDIADTVVDIASEYTGLMLEVAGNGQAYNLHLRTRDLWLPWQSYRSTFTATPQWQTIYLPFDNFEPYRTGKALKVSRLKTIGVLAIGRAYQADICFGKVALYR